MYYLELYDATDTKAKWWKSRQSFADVLRHLSAREPTQILRIQADVDAPQAELRKLVDMGARSF
ncbi:MAG: hypothetical protein NT113_04765 [Hyphomicrobiales bacterium]|jgi:hypothetical protein|nr:hypothetical protein [Hyphomicrobiales bacterium]